MIDITLRGFAGPLDLLLKLARTNNYPLDAIPVARITGQFIAIVQSSEGIDIDEIADFIETASWLIYLKSRSLLPTQADTETPAQELHRVLLEQELLKAGTLLLQEQIAKSGLVPAAVPRGRGSTPTIPAPEAEPLRITVKDTLAAARRAYEIAKKKTEEKNREAEEWSETDAMSRLRSQILELPCCRGTPIKPWFAAAETSQQQTALLLALLELTRLQEVQIAQWEPCGAIYAQRPKQSSSSEVA